MARDLRSPPPPPSGSRACDRSRTPSPSSPPSVRSPSPFFIHLPLAQAHKPAMPTAVLPPSSPRRPSVGQKLASFLPSTFRRSDSASVAGGQDQSAPSAPAPSATKAGKKAEVDRDVGGSSALERMPSPLEQGESRLPLCRTRRERGTGVEASHRRGPAFAPRPRRGHLCHRP